MRLTIMILYTVVYVKNFGKNLFAGLRFYHNTRLSLSLLSLPSPVFVIHFRRHGKCTCTCVHHTNRLQRSKLPLGSIRRTTCGECNNPSYIGGLDSSRTSPDEHSKRYDPSPCGVIHHYRNDNCFRKFSPRPDATTVFTMSNHDRSDVPQYRSHPSLPIIYYTRIVLLSHAFVYTRRYSRTF